MFQFFQYDFDKWMLVKRDVISMRLHLLSANFQSYSFINLGCPLFKRIKHRVQNFVQKRIGHSSQKVGKVKLIVYLPNAGLNLGPNSGLKQELDLQIEEPISLLTLLKQNKFYITHFCNGQCTCGTCLVKVHPETTCISAQSSREVATLGYTHAQNGFRLACQAIIQSEGTLTIQLENSH